MSIFYTQSVNKWNSLEDEELLKEFQVTRDNSFFTELFSRYAHLVYFSSFKYLGSREESKEMVMEVFYKILEKMEKEELQLSCFKHWLYVIVRNECSSRYRFQKKISEENKEYKHFISEQITNESLYDLREKERSKAKRSLELQAALNELSGQQRRCMELFFYNDKTYKEIALITKFTEKSVKSFLQNGKRRIKYILTNNKRREYKKKQTKPGYQKVPYYE